MQVKRFRIKDYKGIKDSGWCSLSGDGITVIAGQNEGGKTTVLQALRDFDLPPKKIPATEDYEPTAQENVSTEVTVEFVISDDDLNEMKASEISQTALAGFVGRGNLFQVTRKLATGDFIFDAAHESLFTDAGQESAISRDDFIDALYSEWPVFVYFDSFSDMLPRTVLISSLPGTDDKLRIVRDFLEIADVSVAKLKDFKDDRNLMNYLRTKAGVVTGNFLSYWEQRISGSQSVQLKLESHGTIGTDARLAFYVFDNDRNLYPEQRSKGFLWFLSFYLRLKATTRLKRNSILLIDEPGTYLHPKAQADVLKVLKSRTEQGSSVIYTTHSPYLLPADALHRIRLAVNKGTEGIRIF